MKIYDIKIYPYALTPEQIYLDYKVSKLPKLLYMKWWERLIYWFKITWRILTGKERLYENTGF